MARVASSLSVQITNKKSDMYKQQTKVQIEKEKLINIKVDLKALNAQKKGGRTQ